MARSSDAESVELGRRWVDMERVQMRGIRLGDVEDVEERSCCICAST